MRTFPFRTRGPRQLVAASVAVAGAYFAVAMGGCNAGQPSPGSTASGVIAPPLIPATAGDAGPIAFGGGFVGLCGDGGLGQPTFPPTCSDATPPPISGGTLLITHDGHTAVACDPDRNAIYVVDLPSLTLTYTIGLQAGDEPGRLVEDGDGRVHVALRSGGSLVTIDPKSGTILARRAVCPAPRGVAWDATADVVWVACATGEMVALPSAGGAATTNWVVERDLRDILMSAGGPVVSEFRSAQLLHLGSGGSISQRSQMPAPDNGFTPHVAWRTIAGPSGQTVAVYQEHTQSSLSTMTSGGYGSGSCGFGGGVVNGPSLFPSVDGGTDGAPVPELLPILPILPGSSGGAISAVLSVFGSDGAALLNRAFEGVLPVDVAIAPDGTDYAIAAPGNAFSGSSAFILDGNTGVETTLGFGDFNQVAIAVAFDANGDVVVQTRDPATLWAFPLGEAEGGSSEGVGVGSPGVVHLSGTSSCSTGHQVFHTHAGASIACASCHPEGGDDGHVWLLDGDQRRTPSLRGTIAGTAPYHWPGDQPDLPTLVNNVYTIRMSGQSLANETMTALTTWVQTIPAPPSPAWVDRSAAAAGKALFERADIGCATCHSGEKFTNNQTVDVGTGGAFQVPPLVGVGWRTPLMHDGCASSVADRFGSCATKGHGTLSSLTATDIANLTAYLETL